MRHDRDSCVHASSATHLRHHQLQGLPNHLVRTLSLPLRQERSAQTFVWAFLFLRKSWIRFSGSVKRSGKARSALSLPLRHVSIHYNLAKFWQSSGQNYSEIFVILPLPFGESSLQTGQTLLLLQIYFKKWRATTAASTWIAPFFRSIVAAASILAPVVMTSSIKVIVLPTTAVLDP